MLETILVFLLTFSVLGLCMMILIVESKIANVQATLFRMQRQLNQLAESRAVIQILGNENADTHKND